MAVPSIKLNSGFNVPVIGLGTWKSPADVIKKAVVDAIESGYRHIDCAPVYQNEDAIGEALREVFQSGKVKREDLFITSKLWNTYHSKERVAVCLGKTLASLGLDYLDLYLIHWPMGYKEVDDTLFPKDEEDKILGSDVDYLESWKAMEGLVKKGLVRSIGLSNHNSEQIGRIIAEGEIKPAMLQVECHLYLQQKQLYEFCKGKGIAVTAYSPLGSPDRPWAKPGDPKLLDDPVITGIAAKRGKSPAQVCLRYLTQRGFLAIPKSVTKSRIEHNIQIFDFTLSDDDLSELGALEKHERVCHLTWVNNHEHYPFKIPF